MKSSLKTALAALALAAAAVAPAAAAPFNQLAASAGLSQSEAAGMTTAQIAAHFFNRGESNQDRQTIPGWADREVSAMGVENLARGLGVSARNMPARSLTEAAALHSNRGVSLADQITVVRPVPGAGSDGRQLAASAGLGLDGAEGRSLTEIVAILFNRGESRQDWQTVAN